MTPNPTEHPVLVVGATGHVGSQIVRLLAGSGTPVRALIRRETDRVIGVSGSVDYVPGDLFDRDSLVRALKGIRTVISTANAIIPEGRTHSITEMADAGYEALISAAEDAGVHHFIQSSVPTYAHENQVPELAGKRRIEARLAASPMHTTIVRNPAFMDVWLVMAGAGEAQSPDPHATTSRSYGFLKTWRRLTGKLARNGWILAPGGASHGAPFIATQDVAQLMVGAVGRQDMFNRTVEAGGPEWVTWAQVASKISDRLGREVRVIPIPASVARAGQILLQPIAPSAANVLGLVRLVADQQPRWEAPAEVTELDLPPQITVDAYLDQTLGKAIKNDR